MENKEKKIALIIVEGGSDRYAFQKCINNYLSSLSSQANIECEVYDTDIRIHDFRSEKIIPTDDIDEEDIKKRICESITNFLAEQKGTYINIKDIVAVAILCDLDACYCKDSDIVSIPSNTDKYDLANKKFNAKDVPFQSDLNRWKRDSHELLLNSVKTIIYKDADNNKTILPIKCFYQSINLEHITSNDPNILDEDLKSIKAKDFRNSYKNKPSDFYSLINSLSLIGYDYETSWNRIDLENKSFERMANIKYLIDWIVSVAQ